MLSAENLDTAFYVQEPFEKFLGTEESDSDIGICQPHHYIEDTDRNVLILHSSGTTGMPKPISSSHRYLLGFTACHSFADPAHAQGVNVSTLPLYHVCISTPSIMALDDILKLVGLRAGGSVPLPWSWHVPSSPTSFPHPNRKFCRRSPTASQREVFDDRSVDLGGYCKYGRNKGRCSFGGS